MKRWGRGEVPDGFGRIVRGDYIVLKTRGGFVIRDE